MEAHGKGVSLPQRQWKHTTKGSVLRVLLLEDLPGLGQDLDASLDSVGHQPFDKACLLLARRRASGRSVETRRAVSGTDRQWKTQ